MSPKLFNKIIPTAKVNTEPIVLMSTILPANFEFGHKNRSNNVCGEDYIIEQNLTAFFI